MKGRIFVVDHTFMENVNDKMEIKAKLPPISGSRLFGSLTSIIADMYQLQLGDYVFLWETKGNNPDSYIWGVYRIISNPFFDYDEPEYIKAKIELAYSFKNPITEYDILNDPYNKIDLWNIVGKKVADKSRASTPLSPYETEFLIQKLINENPDYKFYNRKTKKVKINNCCKIIKNCSIKKPPIILKEPLLDRARQKGGENKFFKYCKSFCLFPANYNNKLRSHQYHNHYQ